MLKRKNIYWRIQKFPSKWLKWSVLTYFRETFHLSEMILVGTILVDSNPWRPGSWAWPKPCFLHTFMAIAMPLTLTSFLYLSPLGFDALSSYCINSPVINTEFHCFDRLIMLTGILNIEILSNMCFILILTIWSVDCFYRKDAMDKYDSKPSHISKYQNTFLCVFILSGIQLRNSWQ